MRRLGRRLAVVLVVGAFTGCGGSSSTPTFDASTVSIEGESLVPVSPGICHVRGTILNATPDTGLTVFMRWQAYDAGSGAIGTTGLTVAGIQPASRVSFESTGFASNDRGLIDCSTIARFERIETTINPG